MLSINEIKNVYHIENNKSEIKFTLKDNQDRIYIPNVNYKIKKLNNLEQLKVINNNLELD